MSMSLFIIGIILGGIATLVSVIFLVISLAGGKNQNAAAWGVAFVICLSVLVLSVYQVVKGIGEKVKSGVEWLEEHKDDSITDADDHLSKSERQDFIDTLQKYVNPSLQDKVPLDFYINKPAEKTADSKIIVPFLYPLSIRYNPSDELGEIISDVSDSAFLGNIVEIAFDENFVIAKVDNSGDQALLKDGRGEIEYVLFDMRTREYLTFVSDEQLIDKSGKIGYTGPQYMRPLSELYRGWIDNISFDY